ncbi:hypothetical protein [Pyxidicoccus trucidator]|uniref:hypothetical protein n=1 Tax=Pyxidicoccus trucidator TaxID=2709662 RepID=UPI001967544A|nr:hypothetical protein [Pyxidicoccus trucidator]
MSEVLSLTPDATHTAHIPILTDAVFDAPEPERTAAIDRLLAVHGSRDVQVFLNSFRPAPLFIPSRMIDMLDHADARARHVAATFIKPGQFPAGIPGLLRGLADPDGRVREACVAAFQEGNLDLAGLREHLTSPRMEVRETALQVLFTRAERHERFRMRTFFKETPAFCAELEPLLTDTAAPVRHLAAVLLENTLETAGGWETLLDAARSSSDERVRDRAMECLVTLRPRMAHQTPEVVRTLGVRLKEVPQDEERRRLIEQLGRLAEQSVDVTELLIGELRRAPSGAPLDGELLARRDSCTEELVDALSRYRSIPDRVLPRLLAELEDSRLPGLGRAGLIRALTWFGMGEEVVDAFVRELGRDTGESVEAAAQALIPFQGEKRPRIARLLEVMERPTLPLIARYGVAVVLGHWGEPAAIAPLRALLEQEGALFPMRTLFYSETPRSCHAVPVQIPFMKILAARALGNLGRPAVGVLPALLENVLGGPPPLANAMRSAVLALAPTRAELDATLPELMERLPRRTPRRWGDRAKLEKALQHEFVELVQWLQERGSTPP